MIYLGYNSFGVTGLTEFHLPKSVDTFSGYVVNQSPALNILTVDEITYKKITALFGGYFWSYILLSLIAIDFILIILGIIFAVKYHQNKSINKYHCTDKNVDIKLKKKYQKCKRKYKTLTYDEFYNEFKDKKIYSSFPDY